MKPMSPIITQFNGNRPPLAKQFRKALPVYAAVLFLILFFSVSSDSFTVKPSGWGKRTQQNALSTVDLFPRKIWQTWKVNPLGFEERDSTTARTWTARNPGHRYEVLTDDNDMMYVETNFGPNGVIHRQDIVDTYRALTAKIIKADLLRYLVMYIDGGVYTDIDVEALRPVERFVPERFNEKDINMIIGIEIDQPDFKDHPVLGKKSMSFCQWTFMCKPRLPVMLVLVDHILAWLKDMTRKQGVSISELKLDFDDVLQGTGPSAFTIAVLEYMSSMAGKQVTWDTFHNLGESKLVGSVLVLTVEAFAAGQGHSDSGNHNARTALVKHHYHASQWPLNHPRYSHPVYGEVEKCNWEPFCVAEWDNNKKQFDALSKEEQQAQLTAKKLADTALEGLAAPPPDPFAGLAPAAVAPNPSNPDPFAGLTPPKDAGNPFAGLVPPKDDKNPFAGLTPFKDEKKPDAFAGLAPPP